MRHKPPNKTFISFSKKWRLSLHYWPPRINVEYCSFIEGNYRKNFDLVLFPNEPPAWVGLTFKGKDGDNDLEKYYNKNSGWFYNGPLIGRGWFGFCRTGYDQSNENFGLGRLLRVRWARKCPHHRFDHPEEDELDDL